MKTDRKTLTIDGCTCPDVGKDLRASMQMIITIGSRPRNLREQPERTLVPRNQSGLLLNSISESHTIVPPQRASQNCPGVKSHSHDSRRYKNENNRNYNVGYTSAVWGAFMIGCHPRRSFGELNDAVSIFGSVQGRGHGLPIRCSRHDTKKATGVRLFDTENRTGFNRTRLCSRKPRNL